MLVSVTPMHEKKRTQETSHLVKEDEASSLLEQEEKAEQEVTSTSISLSELQDMQNHISHHPGEDIVTWLLQCWENGAGSLKLEDREAKQLGSLAREGDIDKVFGRGIEVLSLWR